MDYGDEEEGKSEFTTSEIDWGEEPDSSWDGEEDYDNNSWKGGTDSEISQREVYERDEEPWDEETRSESVFDEEENRSWYEETESLISLEETKSHGKNLWSHEADTQGSFGACSEREEEDIPWCEIPYFNHEDENESQRSPEEFVEEEEVKSEAGRDDFEEAYIKEDEDIAEEPRYIQFSGQEQGPEAYLHWENDMENWFRSQHIPKEDRLSYALDTLVGEAQEWWQQEDFWRQNSQPINTWGLLKQSMYRTFVPKSLNKNYTPKKFLFQSAPKKRSAPKQPYSSKLKRRTTPAPIKRIEATLITQAQEEKPMAKVVAPKQSPNSMLEPHGEPKQCKSPKLSKSKEIICYRCHKQGHFAVTCPERNMINDISIESKLSAPEASNDIIEVSFENYSSSIMLLSMPKVDIAGPITEQEATEAIRSLELEEQHPRTTFQIQVSDTYEFIKYCKNIMITRSIKNAVLSTYVPSIMHLIFPLSVKERTGTFERRKSTSNRLMSYHTEGRQTSNPILEKSKVRREEMIFEETSLKNVNNNVPIKEKPPDFKKTPNAPSDTKSSWTRGMTLNSQRRMKANLLSLGADCTVSRSKLSQGGGYDVDIRTEIDHDEEKMHTDEDIKADVKEETIVDALIVYVKAHGTSTTSERDCTVRTAGLDPDPIGDSGTFLVVGTVAPTLPSPITHQMEEGASLEGFWPTQEYFSEKLSLSEVLTHQRSASKWNHPNQSSDEGVIQFTNRVIPHLLDLDIRALNRDFRLNHEELSYKSTCSRNSSHEVITEKWNWFKSCQHEEDIQVTSQHTSNEPDGDQQLLIGDFRQNYEELSCKTTCATLFTNQGSLSNWKKVNTSFGLRDINFLNQRILDLPYLQPSGIRRLQTYLWRPGDLPHHPETLHHVSLSIKTHMIRQNLPHLHFPYPEPSLPYLPYLEPKRIIQQRLFHPSSMHVLMAYSKQLDVPRSHQFAPKLSRLKKSRTCLIWSDFIIKAPTALFI